MLSQLWGREFSGFGGPSWEQKSNKNRLQNYVKKGRHLGIDFSSILVDLEGQVGTENRPKIDPKGHWKPLPPLLDQDGAKIGQDGPKMRPRWGQEGAKTRVSERIEENPGQLGAMLGPTWVTLYGSNTLSK